MTSLGLRVVRIAASDVLADPEAVADSIYRL
jgi:very-short-patch-repair endonuclease